MRTFQLKFRFLIGVLVILLSLPMTAATVTTMEIVPVENQKVFLLSVTTSGSGNVDMRIKTSAGHIVFSDKQESLTSFVKKINMSDFIDGVYTFELEDDFFLNISHFTLTTSGIVTKEEKVVKYCKPMFKWDEKTKTFDINWLLNDYGDARIIITDKDSNVVQRNVIKNKLIIGQRYLLYKLQEGKYAVTVWNGDRSYTKTIKIK